MENGKLRLDKGGNLLKMEQFRKIKSQNDNRQPKIFYDWRYVWILKI